MAPPIRLSPPEHGRRKVQFKTYVPPALKAALAARAITDGHTMTEATERALRAYVNA